MGLGDTMKRKPQCRVSCNPQSIHSDSQNPKTKEQYCTVSSNVMLLHDLSVLSRWMIKSDKIINIARVTQAAIPSTLLSSHVLGRTICSKPRAQTFTSSCCETATTSPVEESMILKTFVGLIVKVLLCQ